MTDTEMKQHLELIGYTIDSNVVLAEMARNEGFLWCAFTHRWLEKEEYYGTTA